jgi:hypothetical protein
LFPRFIVVLNGVTATPLAISLATQIRYCKSPAFEVLSGDPSARADATSLLHQHHAAEQVGLDIDPVEAAHIATLSRLGEAQSVSSI